MNMWNIKCLEPPPIATYKTNSYAEIRKLRSHFKKALDFFNSQTILDKEAALLSRCIYRMKMKFRSDKGLKSMEKLNRVLLQFNYINMRSLLDDFYSLLPKEKRTDLYLPTKNMLDFILVRLQGTAFLMYRATEVAKSAASSMGSRISIGHFWKVALIMLSVTSRIWIICRKILKSCCDFYRIVLPVQKLLKNISKDWLPHGYVFPNNIEEMLKVDFSKYDDKPDMGLFKSIVPVNEIIENLDVEECNEYIEVPDNNEIINCVSDQQLNNEVNKFRNLSAFELLTNDEDLGEIIHESTKQVRHVVNISSDSEDSNSTTNQSFNNNSKAKQNMINRDDCNIKRKRKKILKGNDNKNKNKICINAPKLKLENGDLEKVKMIRPEENEQTNVENVQHYKHSEQNTCKIICKKKNVVSKRNVIENISSVKQLKIFIRNESKCTSKSALGKMDKLQWTMIEKHIKKFIRRVNKNIISDSECLIEAKRVLKATLDN